MKATKFSAHAQYHVTCAQGVTQNHTYQFFDPDLSIHYSTFMGLRRRLRVVYIWASQWWSDFGQQKTVQSKSVPKWRFFGNVRV